MKNGFLFSLAILCASTFPLLAARRTTLEPKSDNAIIYFKEKAPNTEPQYDALQASQSLHREALKAFHDAHYDHARSCFSLALKASPRSEDIILNYTLFSMVVPWLEGQSLSRAEGLLQQLTSSKSRLDPRYSLAQSILAWLKNDSPKALELLEKYPKDIVYFSNVSQDLQKHLLAGGELVNTFWARKLLPMRTPPRVKRVGR
jgi:hypothetical protein